MEEIANFAIHPSDKFIATFTKNYIVRFINLATQETVHQWKVRIIIINKFGIKLYKIKIKIQDHFPIEMVFDNSGQFLALGCVNGVVKVYDVKKGS